MVYPEVEQAKEQHLASRVERDCAQLVHGAPAQIAIFANTFRAPYAQLPLFPREPVGVQSILFHAGRFSLNFQPHFFL